MKGPAVPVTSARPLYTAPTLPAASVTVERSTAMIALARSTVGLQPTIVPPSVAKRKRLGPEAPCSETTKPDPVPLNTVPVGAPTAPFPADGGAGTATAFTGAFACSGIGGPAPS